jgi:transketolase
MTYEGVLEQICETHPDVVVLTAENRAAMRGLAPRLGPRFLDVGICEQTMIGAAAGLALRGRTPIVHALATFLILRAFEFIRTDVGLGGLSVKLVGGVPGFLSEANGPTHQAIEDVALMRGIPGMMVFCPADQDELALGLPEIVASRHPCYIRYIPDAAAVPHGEPFAIGKAEVLAEGDQVTLLTYGLLVREAYQAREILAARGVSAGLVNMRMLAPLDAQAVERAARRSRLLVTVEDHFQAGGLYTMVAETALERRLTTPVLPIALKARWFRPALLADVLRHEGFDAEGLAARIWRHLKEQR